MSGKGRVTRSRLLASRSSIQPIEQRNIRRRQDIPEAELSAAGKLSSVDMLV